MFWVDRTRIHLDRVAELGDFLELEVVLEEGEGAAVGNAIAAELQRSLEVTDLIAPAYVDLLEAAPPVISAWDSDDPAWPDLRAEGDAEGFGFFARFDEDVARFGADRFRMVRAAGTIVGVGGLHADPYVSADQSDSQGVGRLRHLYVRRAWRRRGVGAALVEDLLEASAPRFPTVRLRTPDSGAAAFYEALGFSAVHAPDQTHIRAR